MKEKLIDILECIGIYEVTMNAELIADYLIANGGTVQRWIPVTERLPEMWRDVIICDVREGYVMKGFLDDDKVWYGNECVMYDFEEFTHWMPLPNPPKDGE